MSTIALFFSSFILDPPKYWAKVALPGGDFAAVCLLLPYLTDYT